MVERPQFQCINFMSWKERSRISYLLPSLRADNTTTTLLAGQYTSDQAAPLHRCQWRCKAYLLYAVKATFRSFRFRRNDKQIHSASCQLAGPRSIIKHHNHPRSKVFIPFLVYHLSIVNALNITLTSAGPNQDSKVQQRKPFAIVWSCVSNVIICAWTSAHPNVSPDELGEGTMELLTDDVLDDSRGSPRS